MLNRKRGHKRGHSIITGVFGSRWSYDWCVHALILFCFVKGFGSFNHTSCVRALCHRFLPYNYSFSHSLPPFRIKITSLHDSINIWCFVAHCVHFANSRMSVASCSFSLRSLLGVDSWGEFSRCNHILGRIRGTVQKGTLLNPLLALLNRDLISEGLYPQGQLPPSSMFVSIQRKTSHPKP